MIPLRHGKPWLTRRLRDEADREVRLAIEHELGDAGAGVPTIGVSS